MENTHLIQLSRQVALRRELDVIANNIANINTAGFKGDGAMFEQYLMPVARAEEFARPDRQLSYVQDRGSYINAAQGALQQTGSPLDVAIDGEGLFVVATPQGERYTRAGGLQINAANQLVTADGHPVLGEAGPIQFQDRDRDITIGRDGTISVPDGIRGRLRVVTFGSMQELVKEGSGLFVAPDGAAPLPVANPRVVQGAIERSNVEPVTEMARMIDVTRTYTMIAGMIQQQSDMRRTAIERLADVPL